MARNGEQTQDKAVMPWDLSPHTWRSRFGVYVAILVLVLVGILALTIAILGVALLVDYPRARLLGTAFLFGGLLACYVVLWGLMRLRRLLQVWRLERKSGANEVQIYFLPACLARNYSGPGAVFSDQWGIGVVGVLGPNLLPSLLVGLAGHIVPAIPLVAGAPKIAVGALVAHLVAAFLLHGRAQVMVTGVTPENIRGLHCRGAVVTIEFSKPPHARLNRVRFFVAPAARISVFREIEKAYPSLLPKPYREALDGA